jgi:multisubunit Na+/H+ antiporter MnhE subunit
MDPTALNSVVSKSLNEFSMSSLMAGFVFGVIGFWALRQGMKNGNLKVLAVGIVQMVFPYFVSNAWLIWGIGIALCFLIKQWW